VGRGKSLYVKSAAAKIFKNLFLPLVWVRRQIKTTSPIVPALPGHARWVDFLAIFKRTYI